MEIIVAILVGYILGSTSPEKLKTLIHDKVKSFHNYFKTPSSGRIELNWGVNKLLELFSEPMAQKWYESRAHLNAGIFKSILAVLGFIYLVRIDLMNGEGKRGVYKVFTLNGFKSLEKTMDKIDGLIKLYVTEVNTNRSEELQMSYYQTFIAGHNVVEDCFNGRL